MSYSGSKHHAWRGGRRTTKYGYVIIYLLESHPLYKTKRYIQEHRLVMERHLGRYLRREERVRHINGIKNDNRIENLKLFPNEKAHQKKEKHNHKVNPGCFKKGHKRGMTGKKHSKKTIAKIKESNLKRYQDDYMENK